MKYVVLALRTTGRPHFKFKKGGALCFLGIPVLPAIAVVCFALDDIEMDMGFVETIAFRPKNR